jgi:hypothetical protein
MWRHSYLSWLRFSTLYLPVLMHSIFPPAFLSTVMNSTRAGGVHLSGRAYVENTRPVPGKPRSVILDVYVAGSRCEEEEGIACSLRFFKGEEAMIIIEGLYDIVATVCSFFHLRYTMASQQQIMF